MSSCESLIFILDEDHHLLAASQAKSDANAWVDALLFKDNRLVGISGVRDAKFRSTILNGSTETKTILLRTMQDEDPGTRLILKVIPLHRTPESLPETNPPRICLEIQTLENFYNAAATRVSEKFNLTKAETTVLKCLMMGLSSDEIQEKMMIGTPTLRTHQQRLRQKTGERSSIRAILSALNPETLVDHLIDLEET